MLVPASRTHPMGYTVFAFVTAGLFRHSRSQFSKESVARRPRCFSSSTALKSENFASRNLTEATALPACFSPSSFAGECECLRERIAVRIAELIVFSIGIGTKEERAPS